LLGKYLSSTARYTQVAPIRSGRRRARSIACPLEGDATWMIRSGMRVMTRPDTRSNRPAIEIADILRRHGDAYRRVHAVIWGGSSGGC